MGVLVAERVKLIWVLLALQFCLAVFHIVSRLALNIGVSKVVYPVYRNLLALLLLSPLAYFFEKSQRPPLTISLLAQFFLLALVGITANQGFYLLGLYYASPTLAPAMQNSVPAITFVMASALRLEAVNATRRDGLAKILGTIACVGGATIIILYKGPPLLHLQMHQIEGYILAVDQASRNMQNWTCGCIYLLGNCLAWAAWMVFQASMLKKYPAKLTLTSFTCFFGVIQFLMIAAFVETDWERWKIQSAEELFTILYAGVVTSGIVVSVQTWCIQKSGPVFVAVFQPLQTFIVGVMAALIFGDQLYSGGVVGVILIVPGLYLVLWGKTNEKRFANSEETSVTKPLLSGESGAAPKDIP
ncbi:WAT1-related protein At3g18200-like [Neltuma alba]|uniref:WAT1-related protein At3g18200-like n=1 Tax=Neltuma alba TaxID=207710 RepID=UPI0010A2B6EA|nr:WAT1-related protein At3g18200-like [Prosopis alba]